MKITRALAGLALTTAFVALAPLAAQAASATSWGPYYAPGSKAKAVGTLDARGEDHADIPTADIVKISGKVYDLTRSSSTCGWAVFRITYRDAGGNLPFTHRSFRDCSYGTPLKFSFTRSDVYQVELKVCAEGKAAKPSLNCLYAGTWKTLYLSK
ncbi:hypothetical protein IMZ11_40925 [Microtetraspora sp. AC03309]|uniref:hypothetical protein n=1 Tax=Microtetraspora sp. AC03309 TaxID=2779376 RepID=UPI001E394DB8|nr:hypothetical protein [Microtetraspora sp. AC03309]MCC5581985.1 hypothetical protein [Microtetraspora sp. AC03309]